MADKGRSLIVALVAILAACSDGRTPLVIYSPHGRDLLTLVEHRYEEQHPDVDGRWLDMGHHGEMAWMKRTRAIRQDVSKKVPGARSVVVVARNYYSKRPEPRPGTGRVAAYAWGRDYHRVMRKPLEALGEFIESLEEGGRWYASVDSGPVMERSWAARAGVGSIGKNSLSLRRDMGHRGGREARAGRRAIAQ